MGHEFTVLVTDHSVPELQNNFIQILIAYFLFSDTEFNFNSGA